MSNKHLVSRPITKKEFDEKITNVKEPYRSSIVSISKYGTKLDDVCNEGNFCRRSLQRELKKLGWSYMCLKMSFISQQLSKGYTMKSIREDLGMKNKKPLNNLMWEKVRGDVRPSIRWKILKKDNFRCVLCGSDATDRKLHIDHIIPVSEGGNSRMKNLRVLCASCNLGRNTDLNLNNVDFASPNKDNQHITKLNSDAE